MAIIDGFTMVEETRDHGDRPYITLRNRSVTFSKSAVVALHYAEFVHMYVDEKGKRAAFVPCGDEENAIRFYKKPAEGRQMLVRISDVKKARLLMRIAGINDCGKGIRIYGNYIKEENTLLIPMSIA